MIEFRSSKGSTSVKLRISFPNGSQHAQVLRVRKPFISKPRSSAAALQRRRSTHWLGPVMAFRHASWPSVKRVLCIPALRFTTNCLASCVKTRDGSRRLMTVSSSARSTGFIRSYRDPMLARRWPATSPRDPIPRFPRLYSGSKTNESGTISTIERARSVAVPRPGGRPAHSFRPCRFSSPSNSQRTGWRPHWRIRSTASVSLSHSTFVSAPLANRSNQ